jgi:hypothetical protein
LTTKYSWIESMALKNVLAALAGCLCLMDSALAEESSVLDKTMSALSRAADATVRGVERGARAAGHGIEAGLAATEYGIKRGAAATSDALSKVGEKIVGHSSKESFSNGSVDKENQQKPSPPPAQSKAE